MNDIQRLSPAPEVNENTGEVDYWMRADPDGEYVTFYHHVEAMKALRPDISKFTAAVRKALDEGWVIGYAQALGDVHDNVCLIGLSDDDPMISQPVLLAVFGVLNELREGVK